MELERKSLSLKVSAADDDTGTFDGYGAAFGNVDSWGDIIEPGAFKKTLAAHKKAGTSPAFLWQHDYREPLGVWEVLKEDASGLGVRGRFLKDDVQRAKEAYALTKAGAIAGLSIGYLARDYSIDQKTGIRTLRQVDLLEISLVTFPANEQAQVTGVKAANIATIRDFEAFLRDAGGYSASEAKRIASQGFKERDVPNQNAEIAAVMNQIIKKYTGE